MKTWILILTLVCATVAEATTIVKPSVDVIAPAADRPSCEMLAWRWVKTLSRLQEKDLVLRNIEETGAFEALNILAKRVPTESPEGATPEVARKLTFNVPGATASNTRVVSIDTPTVLWRNVSENLTDLVVISVKNGTVGVEAPTPYADYCFSLRPSEVLLEVNGRFVKLKWSTRHLNFQKYLNLLKG